MNNYTVGCIADLISSSKKKNNNTNLKKKKINEDTEIKPQKNTKLDSPNKSKRKFADLENSVISTKKVKKDDSCTEEESFKNQFKNKKLAKKIVNKQILNINNKGEGKKKSKHETQLFDTNIKIKKSSLNKLCDSTEKENLVKSENLSDLKRANSNSSQEKKSSEIMTKNQTLKTKNTKQKKKVKPEKKLYTDFTKNTIFIGNLPLTYDKQKVCKIFSKYGQIDSARIRCVPIPNINMKKKVASIKKEFNPNRNSLVAYVRYKSENSAIQALKSDGMIIDQHHIRVDLAETNKERDMKKAIFVGGLPFNIEDDDLWEFFKNCGKINSVRIIRDSQTAMGKGFGYVNFDSTASVELALQMNGQELKKRIINIKRCTNKMKKNKITFDKSKSAEMSGQLLSKKNKVKKFKIDKTKSKKDFKLVANDFQGRKANEKKKKKKKPSKNVLQKKKISKILQSSYDLSKDTKKKKMPS